MGRLSLFFRLFRISCGEVFTAEAQSSDSYSPPRHRVRRVNFAIRIPKFQFLTTPRPEPVLSDVEGRLRGVISESCFIEQPEALFFKRLVLIFVLFLASVSWHTEAQAQSAPLHLTWTDTSDNEDGFKIERLVGGLVDKTLTVAANITSFIDSALVAGTVYCYRVEAFNSAGNSDPSNQGCATAQSSIASVSANPTAIGVGGTVTATWSGISAAKATDWIGLYLPGAADTNLIDWIYVSCSKTSTSARASGSCSYVLPGAALPREHTSYASLLVAYTRLATSNGFAVTAGGITSAVIAANPTAIGVGGTVTATWSGISAAKATDWIGLYLPGAADTNLIDWIYVSCSKTSTSARASGSCSYVLPGGLAAGTYELRLFAGSYTRLATSNGFAITAGGTPALTVSPTKAGPGATVTAMWSGITAPSPKDWIGLYTVGTDDTKFITWNYVSCSTTAGSARASGSCLYLLPGTLSAGNYELRLFAGAYTRLATSNTLTVSVSSNSPPIVLANSTSNGSNAGLLPPVAREWSDYDLRVNLRSMNNNSIGVMFRYQDDRNYYRLVWNQKSKFRQLEKIENGIPTVLAKDTVGYVKGRNYQAQIIAQGTTLKVFIDGAQIFSVTDSTFSEGTIGLYSSSNPASFDNIVVQDINTGAVLLSDDFNEGVFTGWTVVDQGKNHGPSAWSVTRGTLLQTSTIDGTFALYTLRNWRDYRLTLKMLSQDLDSVGVMFRYQDNDNYYRFSWNRQNNFRRLEKRLNGVFTMLAEDTKTYVTGQTYLLEVVATGTTLGVTIDGTSIFSALDSSFNAGTIALYSSSNQGSSFDDVLVQDLATGAVLLSDDFNDGAFTGWTIVDEGTDQNPSAWSVKNGSFVQSSNIGSNGTNNLGTYALY